MYRSTILSTGLLVLALFSLSPTSAFGQGQNVLVWGTGSSASAVAAVAAYIDATGTFNTVDSTDQVNQTLAQLTAYDAVLFFTNGGGDPLNGDVLADYADTGAWLVLCTFSWADQGDNTLGGRIVSDELSPFVVAGSSLYTSVTMASNDGSDYFTGVSSITGYYHDDVALNPGAVQNAAWSDGQPMVATLGNVVGINLFPQALVVSGDYQQLFTNAITAENNCVDDDNDGYGVGDTTDCVNAAVDCDDANALTYPGAPEVCDGLDNDCDGSPAADEVDIDNDGVTICAGDCDDANSAIYPGAPEICDGLDNNCDGNLLPAESDDDADGAIACAGDCDDNDPLTYPGASEVCDGVDNNCDGQVPADEADEDADGFRICEGDCDDLFAEDYPGAPELCDGYDNNCDGNIPEDETDPDGDTWRACDGDCDPTDATVYPSAE